MSDSWLSGCRSHVQIVCAKTPHCVRGMIAIPPSLFTTLLYFYHCQKAKIWPPH